MASLISGYQGLLQTLYNVGWQNAHVQVFPSLDILELRTKVKLENQNVPFYDVVAQSTGLKCSDPRDIVFALTSLSPTCGIQPDYNLSYTDVRITFSRYVVQSGHFGMLLDTIQDLNLHLRHGVATNDEGGSRSPERTDLPSWVLDVRRGLRRHHKEPLVAVVNPDNSLSCNVHRIGVIYKIEGNYLWLGTHRAWRPRTCIRNMNIAKTFFPYPVLGRPGDVLFAFEHSQAECRDVLLLRRTFRLGSYRLLHWNRRIRLELDGHKMLLPDRESTAVRIF